jgi:hypothetical protein
MLAQVDNSGLIFSMIGLTITITLGVAGIMLKIISNIKKEFEKHKESVRYVDTCEKEHKGLTKLLDERHNEIKDELKEIKDLIRNNGNSKPRVRT